MAVAKKKTAKKSLKKAVKKVAKKSAKPATKSAKGGAEKGASADKKTAKKTAKKSAKKTATKKTATKKVATKKTATKKTVAKKPVAKATPKVAPKIEAQPEAQASAPVVAKPQRVKAKASTIGKKTPKPKGESPKQRARHPATRRHTYRAGKAATPTLKRGEQDSKWIVIDADGLVLGRLASRVALRLRGKHLPTYTPHINAGDTVIIINASKVALTGNKEKNKIWYRHTGYVGGIKEETPATLRAKAPEKIIRLAVSRMLPKGPLARRQLSRLKVYAGAEHPHTAQSPEPFDLGAENRKNRA